MPMNTSEQEFFIQAIRLEYAAERAYRLLVDLVIAQGQLDSMEFFDQMAEYSRTHREAIMRQAGIGDLSAIALEGDCAGVGEVPRVDPSAPPADLNAAMEFALAAERNGVAFYEAMARMADDPQLRTEAENFAAEERAHVLALERFMGLKPY